MSLPHKVLSRWSCGFDFGLAFTLFGYQFGFSFDLTEWHLMWEHYDGVGYLLCVGPIVLDILDATNYTDPVEKVIQDLRDTLQDINEVVSDLYVRLAACGGTAKGSIGSLSPEHVEYSDAQNEVAILFKKYKQALLEIEKLRKKQGGKNVKGKSLSTGRTSRKS